MSFRISTPSQPHKRYHIQKAFTAEPLSPAEYSYPCNNLCNRNTAIWKVSLSSPSIRLVHCCWSEQDYPHLITPIEPVRLVPPGGPAAVKTRLGWMLQGPARVLEVMLNTQCLHSTFSPSQTELFRNMESFGRQMSFYQIRERGHTVEARPRGYASSPNSNHKSTSWWS